MANKPDEKYYSAKVGIDDIIAELLHDGVIDRAMIERDSIGSGYKMTVQKLKDRKVHSVAIAVPDVRLRDSVYPKRVLLRELMGIAEKLNEANKC